jgi:hypothetical protein
MSRLPLRGLEFPGLVDCAVVLWGVKIRGRNLRAKFQFCLMCKTIGVHSSRKKSENLDTNRG